MSWFGGKDKVQQEFEEQKEKCAEKNPVTKTHTCTVEVEIIEVDFGQKKKRYRGRVNRKRDCIEVLQVDQLEHDGSTYWFVDEGQKIFRQNILDTETVVREELTVEKKVKAKMYPEIVMGHLDVRTVEVKEEVLEVIEEDRETETLYAKEGERP